MNILPKATASARPRSIVVAPVLVCTPPLCRQNGMGAREVKFPPIDYGPCFGHSFAARTSGNLSLKCAVIGMLRVFYRVMGIP